MAVKSYRELLVWQKGINLVKEVYQITNDFPHQETYGLASQIQRAAVSVPSNIAEGQARQHPGEFRHFLYIALGSLAELDTQTEIAMELSFISEGEHKLILEKLHLTLPPQSPPKIYSDQVNN